MANGISKNPLTDISNVYLNQIAEGSLKSLEKASVLAMSYKPEDQDKAREIKTRFDYQSLMKQKKAKKGKVMETRSDWRNDLREIITADKASDEPEIKEKKIKNKITINPSFKEAVEDIGGELLEVQEMDPKKEEQIKKKEKQMKKRMLMMKMRAVQQGAGDDVVAGYEPEGDMVEAKYERGASDYGKMSIRNKRAVGYGGNAAPPEERRKAHDERMKKHRLKKVDECWKTHKQQGYKKKGGKMVPNCVPKNEEVQFEATRYAKETGKSFKSGKPMVKGGTAKDDNAFQAVAKKYAGQMMGGQQKKKVRGQKPDESNTPFERAAARVKQMKIDNKALADKAKKAGYKSTQDYVNVQAVRKGGLGT